MGPVVGLDSTNVTDMEIIYLGINFYVHMNLLFIWWYSCELDCELNGYPFRFTKTT